MLITPLPVKNELPPALRGTGGTCLVRLLTCPFSIFKDDKITCFEYKVEYNRIRNVIVSALEDLKILSPSELPEFLEKSATPLPSNDKKDVANAYPEAPMTRPLSNFGF